MSLVCPRVEDSILRQDPNARQLHHHSRSGDIFPVEHPLFVDFGFSLQ